MWDEVYFWYADKHQSILQAGTTIFGGHGWACTDNQPSLRVLRRAISQKGLDGLPWFFTAIKNFIKTLKVFPSLDRCIDGPEILSVNQICRIIQIVISCELGEGKYIFLYAE